MDPMSEFDIRDSFDAMDKDKVGRISMDSFKIVYLGLGYPKSGFEDLSEQVLRIQDNIDDGLSLKTVKIVLSKFSRDRNQELSRDFSLADRNGDRFISMEDVLVLSEEAGDKVSPDVADAMLHHASKTGVISHSAFAELFKPE